MAQRLNDLKTTAAMSAKISVFVICVEAIIYLLLQMCFTVPLMSFHPENKNDTAKMTLSTLLLFSLYL